MISMLRASTLRIYEDLKARWTGLSEEQIAECVRRARETGSGAGVVVVSRGAERAGALLAAIQRGLVSQIIVDTELAAALMRGVSTPPARL